MSHLKWPVLGISLLTLLFLSSCDNKYFIYHPRGYYEASINGVIIHNMSGEAIFVRDFVNYPVIQKCFSMYLDAPDSFIHFHMCNWSGALPIGSFPISNFTSNSSDLRASFEPPQSGPGCKASNSFRSMSGELVIIESSDVRMKGNFHFSASGYNEQTGTWDSDIEVLIEGEFDAIGIISTDENH